MKYVVYEAKSGLTVVPDPMPAPAELLHPAVAPAEHPTPASR